MLLGAPLKTLSTQMTLAPPERDDVRRSASPGNPAPPVIKIRCWKYIKRVPGAPICTLQLHMVLQHVLTGFEPSAVDMLLDRH